MNDDSHLRRHAEAMEGLIQTSETLLDYAKAFEVTGNIAIARKLNACGIDIQIMTERSRKAYNEAFYQAIHNVQHGERNLLMGIMTTITAQNAGRGGPS